MAVPPSENIEKVKKCNQQEDVRMKLHLNELQKQRQLLLDNLQKEQLRMVHQVKANRIRELRQTLREGLGMEEQVNMMRQKFFPGRGSMDHSPRAVQQETKGFSKIDIEEDDDDDIYMEFLQQRTRPKLHVMQAKWALRREKDEKERANDKDSKGNLKKKEPDFDINDDEIFLRYPCDVTEKTHGVMTLRDLQDFQRGRLHLRYKQPEKSNPKHVQSVTLRRSRYPLPKHVSLMQRMGDLDIDEYTDGTMALEMRRFKQKQRERTPVPVGFLPVRRRYIDEFDHLYDEHRDSNNVASSAPAMSIHGKPPAQVRVYLPKPAAEDVKPEEEEREEHERLMKLRKADQAGLYKESIERSTSLLGPKTALQHQKLIPQEMLSREETIMLRQLQQVPSFRSGSKMVKSAPSTRYTRSQPRSSKNSDQIRNIMNYVLTKDYSGEDRGWIYRGAPRPPRLEHDCDDSD